MSSGLRYAKMDFDRDDWLEAVIHFTMLFAMRSISRRKICHSLLLRILRMQQMSTAHPSQFLLFDRSNCRSIDRSNDTTTARLSLSILNFTFFSFSSSSSSAAARIHMRDASATTQQKGKKTSTYLSLGKWCRFAFHVRSPHRTVPMFDVWRVRAVPSSSSPSG